MSGLRAELGIQGANACPVAAVSTAADEPIRNVEWAGSHGTVERFGMDTDDLASIEGESADGPAERPAMEQVFADDSTAVVEFEREWDDCVCELIEATGCPVESVEARDGELAVTVHTRSRERLRTVIAAAREAATQVSLNYVVTGGETEAVDPVVVDRGRLTERQQEVVTTAYQAGYFDHPRSANAEAVAQQLDITPATFREHLATAQRKLLGAVVE